MRWRLRRRLLQLCVLGPCLLYAGFETVGGGIFDVRGDQSSDTEGTRRTLTYLPVAAGGWVEFPIPPGRSGLRVLSTAHLHADDEAAPGELRLPYTLEYELVEDGSTPLRYHENATAQADAPPRAFLLESSQRPLPSQTIRMDLRGRTARALRIRVASRDPRIASVAFRAYALEDVPERTRAYRWQRLTVDERSRRFSSSVYPPDLARSSEREALLASRWAPLGPDGVSGADFVVRPLYLRVADEQEDGADGEIAARPEGLLADSGSRITIPVPPWASKVHLTFEPPAPEDTARRVVAVAWIPEGLRSPRHWRVDLPRGRGEEVVEAGAGSLVVTSGAPVVVRARLQSEGAAADITPEATLSSAWRTMPEEPITWTLTQSGELPLPVRIDVRPLRAPDAPARAASVRVEMLDAADRVLRTERIDAPPWEGDFERELLGASYRSGAPRKRFLMVPTEAVSLRASGGTDAALSVFVRPPELPHLQYVPEDLHDYPVRGAKPALWFGLAPEGAEALVRAGRRVLLSVSPEPEAPDPELLAGRYTFERLRPLEPVLGRDLLLPRFGAVKVRESGIAAWYRPLERGSETVVEFAPDPLRGEILPELRWRADQSVDGTARVRLDGRTLLETTIAGREGALRLPAVEAGPHRLEVSAPDGTTWLVNHAGRARGVINRLRRPAIRVPDDGRLTFEIDKGAGATSLSFALHRPDGVRERSRVSARLSGTPRQNSADAFTVTARRFEVARAAGEAAWAVGAQEALDAGEPFYFPLSADLPAGRYRLDLEIEDAGRAYLSAWRLRPGPQDRQRFEIARASAPEPPGRGDE